jgi:hypothetical protein
MFPDLQDFVDRLAADGLDGSTIRNTVNPLRVIYRRARYQIPVNPTTGLEIVAAGNKPRRIVAPDVGAKMVAAVPLEERALRATAFMAGLRNGELQGQRIEDIELFEQGRWGLIHVRAGWDRVEGARSRRSRGTRLWRTGAGNAFAKRKLTSLENRFGPLGPTRVQIPPPPLLEAKRNWSAGNHQGSRVVVSSAPDTQT